MARALLDTNVLVHAAYRASALHADAATLVDRALRERGEFCISPQNLIEFCAIATRIRFVDPPLTMAQAQAMASRLYRSRRLTKIHPVRGTVARAIRDGVALGIIGPRWYDLYLAATMRDAGVSEIVTEDLADFAKIPFVTARPIREAK